MMARKEVVISTREWLRALLWTREAMRLRIREIDLSRSRILKRLIALLEKVPTEGVTVRMTAWWIARMLSCIPLIEARLLVVLGYDYLEVPVDDFKPSLECRERFVRSVLGYARSIGALALIRVHDGEDEAWVVVRKRW